MALTTRIAIVPVLLALAALLNACGGGSGGSSPPPPPPPPLTVVTISGTAQYEFVPANANCNGLNFSGTELRPIRRATIQLIDAASNAVLDSDVTNDNGGYALSVDASSNVFLRVRAELQATGAPAWDVEVRDNTSETQLDLAQRPLYVLDGADFNSGTTNSTRDVTATTGWNTSTSSYSGTRAAASFAVLDAIYESMRLLLAENPLLAFPPLDAFWSVNNSPTGSFPDGVDSGEIGTSFYVSGSGLFLLGMDGVDTEEFDDHVISHEWGHYFEDVFSRSDSVGGAHGIGDQLDMRVAFGEGWATALAGMALDDPEYCDTLGAGNQSGFRINIESPGNIGTPGWYNELSVMKIIYDLWDDEVDGVDTMSIGFSPIYDVMTGEQADTPAFTSIFSFAEALKRLYPQHAAFVDALLEAEDITADGITAYGDTETNDGPGSPQDVLPVYTTVVPDGSTINICSNSQFDSNADGNKLSEYRFLRMTLAAAARLEVEIRTNPIETGPDDPDDDHDQSDPDIYIYRAGQIQNQFVNGEPQGLSGDANQEIFTTPNALPAGDYVMSLIEFRYQDEESPADFPARTCFDVRVTAL